MKQNFLIIAFVISAYFLSQWIESVATQEVVIAKPKAIKIDSFFTDYKTIITNKSGYIKHTIEGKSLQHFNNSISKIELPIVQFHKKNSVDWVISANNAEVEDKKNTIRFISKVIALNLQEKEESTKLSTEMLEVLTKEKIIRTDKKVTIESSNSFTTAVGMIANTEKEEILLLNQVKSRFYEN
jgi:LPS export ABC transporter protein LptC